ncbi:hypothetical protein SYNPS1DRAFT_16417, partial [Syncephalis pseudoplumigaleata]
MLTRPAPAASTSTSSPSASSAGRTRFVANGLRAGQNGSHTASEPSLDELKRFVCTLRNRAVALYATNSSILAKHVTAWLTLWGTDISHLSIDGTQQAADEVEATHVSANAS